MAQSVEHQTPDFHSGHDLMGTAEINTPLGLQTQCGVCLQSLPLSLPPLTCSWSLSLSLKFFSTAFSLEFILFVIFSIIIFFISKVFIDSVSYATAFVFHNLYSLRIVMFSFLSEKSC